MSPTGSIPTLDPGEAPRARRWDALILGSGLPALVAAARISSAGQRVLVVEETARTTLSPSLREPFFLGGLRDEGILDATLRRLSVPLIDRRRIASERLAYQIAADPYRLDVGQLDTTADELVAWGLQSPEEAHGFVRQMVEASEIERRLLLESPFVHIGRRLPRPRTSVPGGHKRGLPGDIASADGALREVIDAQLRALSNLGQSSPVPESAARLLGLGLAGGAGFSDSPPWLTDLLRKRATALYGDFRSVTGGFEMISVSGQPGIRVSRTGEIWLGRVLVLAAPRSALSDLYAREDLGPVPDVLRHSGSRRYRAAFLFRVPIRVVPEGMGGRLLLPSPGGAISITAFPSQTHPDRIELVARALVDDDDPATLPASIEKRRDEIAERLRSLMPFSGDSIARIDADFPQWDGDDGWLEDPAVGDGWPSEIDLRLSSRPPIYHLDRAAVAGLGLEGDLLLGWRGGDAIAAEIA